MLQNVKYIYLKKNTIIFSADLELEFTDICKSHLQKQTTSEWPRLELVIIVIESYSMETGPFPYLVHLDLDVTTKMAPFIRVLPK